MRGAARHSCRDGDQHLMRKHMSTKNDFGWMFITGLGIGLTTIGFVRLIRNRLTLHEAMVLLQQEDNAGTPAHTRSLNRLADRLGMDDAIELRERWHAARNGKSARAQSAAAGK
jgi:hypothetical protein